MTPARKPAKKTPSKAAGAKKRTPSPAKKKSVAKKAAQSAAKTAKAAAPKRAPRRATVKPKAAAKAAPQPRAPKAQARALEPISVEKNSSGVPVIDVINMSREKVGRVELQGPLFCTIPNRGLIHEAVVMQQASQRQGTADTKERGEVSGTGKKPWKQKGTGRARAGSIRSPLWRGGGTVFGPTPRGYGYAFPRKKARAALAGAMSAKVAQGDVLVLEALALPAPKTKLMAGVLKALGLEGSVLIVHGDQTGHLARASANLRRVTLMDIAGLNVYDVLAHRHIVLVQSDLARLREVCA